MNRQHHTKRKTRTITRNVVIRAILTVGIFGLEFLLGYLFDMMGFSELHIFIIFEFGIIATAILCASYICSACSVLGMLIYNFFYSQPISSFHSDSMGNHLTFVILYTSAMLMTKLSKSNLRHTERIEEVAFNRKKLIETCQELLKSKDWDDIIEVTGRSFVSVLDKNILIFTLTEGQLNEPHIFYREGENKLSFCLDEIEKKAALTVFKEGKSYEEDLHRDMFSKGIYFPIQTAERCYGVIGVDCDVDKIPWEVSRLMLGECALGFEREYYSQIREQHLIEIKNEKLRSDMLRSISHDLRTPLTGISGNAALIYKQTQSLTTEKIKSLSKGIWNESTWLFSMVENLLSITKLDEIGDNIEMKPEILEDILMESIYYARSRHISHNFTYEGKQDMNIVRCNPQLISQVMRNLLENSVKYSDEGTNITVRVENLGDQVVTVVSDEGVGISDKDKPFVFERYFIADNRKSTSRRGFGIGLALCKTIIEAHGGEISVSDAKPYGAVFRFSLKKNDETFLESEDLK